MNCCDARHRLPELVYGDLNAEEAAAIQNHMKSCAECRKDGFGLERLRQMLDTLPAPTVRVNLAQVYRSAAERQAKRTRRWRWAAVAACVAAAILLAFFLVRPEIRVQGQQLSLHWGGDRDNSVATPSSSPESSPPPQAPVATEKLEERIEVLTGLLHALATDAELREGDRRREIDALQTRLELLQSRDDVRWNETKRDLAALYVAQFKLPR
jgi:anti-sigma factor RsiW